MKKLTAGQLAKEAQIGVETLRYYENRGILPQPNKSASGYREYSVEDIDQIKLIKKMQSFGFSLVEIKRLFIEEKAHPEGCKTIERNLNIKVAEIEKRISELQEIKIKIVEISKLCQKNQMKECCPLLHGSKKMKN